MRVGQKKKLFTDVIGRAFGDDPSRVNGGTYVRSHYGNNDRNRSRRTTFCLKLAIKVRAGHLQLRGLHLTSPFGSEH